MIEITAENFDSEVTKAKVPVLVDFWADWCSPCRLLAPILDKLAKSYNGSVKFAKVSADDQPMIVSLFKISSLPTLILFKDGKAIEMLIGLQSEKSLKKMLDSSLNES